MKNSYFARQPIMNRDRKTVGYELLYRDGPRNSFPEVDAEYATKLLLSNYFLSGSNAVLDNKLGSVNFPYQSILNRLPALFPKNALMIDILSDCPPTEELLDAVKELSERGYKIALDNFIPSKEWIDFLPYINLIRFDLRVLPIAKIAPLIRRLQKSKIKFLAEKVETYEEFVNARQAGFHYFQGYFFRKPEMIQTKAIQPSFLTIVHLCKAIAQDEVDYDEVEKLITVDVTLSYKLLRYVNSTSSISSEIKSFRQALAYLGKDKLKKFVSLVAISTVKNDKPDSLYSLSLQRAKFCELLSETVSRNHKSQAFLMGLFSLLDSLLDQPLDDVIDAIPIEKEIKLGLLEHSGVLGEILTLVIAYDKAEWDQVDVLTEKLGVIPSITAQFYEDSMVWVEELFGEFR
ncbi:histidine kinase [Vibrio sp. MACH09]|uniref:EAL and HDOD domain-containing protein n=1 Tax=unclassified Vibrio TaxID=2614977 RepID=UPI001493C626|nr:MULTISPECIES: HDOD domain-containing protein [unclassified Vibrio]NOI65727.1 HDOD domain-containing protein [Vibrio sp. 99-8-1]GLO62672.1 histidine kinase [Vibrio sp. MACH09]